MLERLNWIEVARTEATHGTKYFDTYPNKYVAVTLIITLKLQDMLKCNDYKNNYFRKK